MQTKKTTIAHNAANPVKKSNIGFHPPPPPPSLFPTTTTTNPQIRKITAKVSNMGKSLPENHPQNNTKSGFLIRLTHKIKNNPIF